MTMEPLPEDDTESPDEETPPATPEGEPATDDDGTTDTIVENDNGEA